MKKHSICGCCDAEVGGDIGTYSYSYVPGAGDDEESWARGLTPALFWQHHQVTTIHLFLHVHYCSHHKLKRSLASPEAGSGCFCQLKGLLLHIPVAA